MAQPPAAPAAAARSGLALAACETPLASCESCVAAGPAACCCSLHRRRSTCSGWAGSLVAPLACRAWKPSLVGLRPVAALRPRGVADLRYAVGQRPTSPVPALRSPREPRKPEEPRTRSPSEDSVTWQPCCSGAAAGSWKTAERGVG